MIGWLGKETDAQLPFRNSLYLEKGTGAWFQDGCGSETALERKVQGVETG